MSHHHQVPDFEMDDEYSIPTSSPSLSRPKKSAMAEDEEIMELLWRNGQAVVQTQNQRSFKKSHIADEAVTPAAQHSTAREIRSEDETIPHLFMQEDEMASWHHYPVPLDESSFDRDIYSDLFYPAPSALVTAPPPRDVRPPPPSSSVTSTAAPRPPIPPARREVVESSARIQNFMHFTRPKGRMESGPSSSSKAVRESTVVDSNDTPDVDPESRVSHAARSTTQVSGGNRGCGTMSGTDEGSTATAARELATTCDLTMASSSNNSGASVSGSAEPARKQPQEKPEDRKRKGIEADDNEYHSEDADFESADVKKPAHGSTSTKRSRAAEVHNLSERKRRDRINEKMRALQELIPRCNKSDKASMLDEAIEYLKSLQLQIQNLEVYGFPIPPFHGVVNSKRQVK
ncbi:unnamed protein product [Ilex paraguariensis]|uniref:BHLH domain-containing protein n=1 Tax=Ilex paraguariensis TaxID=185542 RepID=A0ABC8T217_9AQUA